METRALTIKTVVGTALLAIALVAMGPTGARASAAISPEVANIPNEVRHQLAMLPWYGVFDHLSYAVNGTVVTLNGQVTSQHAVTRDDAKTFVKSVPGVTQVINNIEVLPPSPNDDQIRREEYRTVFSKGDLGGYTMGAIPQMHIIVKNGHVSLEGTVMNQMDKNLAGLAANTVPGVFSVQNNLQIG